MDIGLQFMHLNGLKESLPFACYFFIFDGDHLIEVDRAVLFALLERILLVSEPAAAAAEGLHVIPSAQLEVQCFQLVLNLSVIGARPRV